MPFSPLPLINAFFAMALTGQALSPDLGTDIAVNPDRSCQHSVDTLPSSLVCRFELLRADAFGSIPTTGQSCPH